MNKRKAVHMLVVFDLSTDSEIIESKMFLACVESQARMIVVLLADSDPPCPVSPRGCGGTSVIVPESSFMWSSADPVLSPPSPIQNVCETLGKMDRGFSIC